MHPDARGHKELKKLNELKKSVILEFHKEGFGLYKEALFMHVPILKKLKGFKIILIKRNPYDVLSSYTRTGTEKNFIRYGKRYLKAYPYLKANFNVIEVLYEDLIADAEGTLRDLCEQLEIRFDKEMLNYYKVDRDYEVNHYSDYQAKKPIFKSARIGMPTKKEIKLCERLKWLRN